MTNVSGEFRARAASGHDPANVRRPDRTPAPTAPKANRETSGIVTRHDAQSKRRCHSLLNALTVRIWFALVDYQPMVEVRGANRDVAHQIGNPCQLIVIDVLRLVGDLVIVAVPSRREEHDRNSIPRVLVVVAAA